MWSCKDGVCARTKSYLHPPLRLIMGEGYDTHNILRRVMGKVKRLRQKYHLLVKKEKEQAHGLTYDEIVSGTYDKIKVPSNSLSKIDNNIFSGINIDIDKLKTSIEDDRVSVRSIAKSLKYDANGKLLKKDEKRKMRHDLFMKKLDVIQQMRNKGKKKKKKNKNNSGMKSVVDEIPQLIKIGKERKPVPKKRGIQKAKKRQKNMLEDISAFQIVLSDPEFKSNPLGCISECVRNKIIKEKIDEGWFTKQDIEI